MEIVAIIATCAIGVICIGLMVYTRWREVKRNKERELQTRKTFLAEYQFPILLANKIGDRYPTLSTTQVDAVVEGLRAWFFLLQNAPRQHYGMPSKAVDTAWHEFILMTRDYEAFCQGAFGRFIHHSPNIGGKQTKSEEGSLARTFMAGSGRGGAIATGAAVGAVGVMGVAAAGSLFNLKTSAQLKLWAVEVV